jgi:hypothetical protein
MRINAQVAAAVAAAIASGGAGAASLPSLSDAATAQGTTNVLYIAGSSAAKPAVSSAVVTLLGGSANVLAITSTGNKNFLAWSGKPDSSSGITGADGATTFDIFYRTEGGSVVGALPVATGAAINQLNLSDGTNITYTGGQTTATEAVSGTSAANGIGDTFGSGVAPQTVQMGITDVEPGALVGNNYPSAYLTSVYGSATAAQMGALTSTPIFAQVFGLFVNNHTGSASTTLPGAIDLNRASAAALLNGNNTKWKKALTTSGVPVTTQTQAVTIINREAGSGSRTSADTFFENDNCTTVASHILDAGATADFFATGDDLTAANLTAGAITYASIDNAGGASIPNLTLVSIDGVTPSNLAAASGQYDFWFEATAIKNTGTGNAAESMYTALLSSMQAEASAPHVVDIVAIPGVGGNVASSTVSSTASVSGGVTIYINQSSRGKVSCKLPVTAN